MMYYDKWRFRLDLTVPVPSKVRDFVDVFLSAVIRGEDCSHFREHPCMYRAVASGYLLT